MSLFERWLTLWVGLCIVAGIALGKIAPGVAASLDGITLDVGGKQFSSKELAGRLQDWQGDGRDLTFVIGGPDGVSAACLDRADVRWSLSKLTLPHGLARVLFVEQLYRAWSLTAGHPYHRA